MPCVKQWTADEDKNMNDNKIKATAMSDETREALLATLQSMERTFEGLHQDNDDRERIQENKIKLLKIMAIPIVILIIIAAAHLYNVVLVMETAMSNMSGQMSQMAGDMRSMSQNMQTMNTSMGSMGQDMGNMSTQITVMREDMSGMRGDIGNMSTNMARMSHDMNLMNRSVGLMSHTVAPTMQGMRDMMPWMQLISIYYLDKDVVLYTIATSQIPQIFSLFSPKLSKTINIFL